MTSSRLPFVIPDRVRRAALQIADRWSVRPADLVEELGTKYGFNTIGELVEVLEARSESAAATFTDVAMSRFQLERGVADVEQILRVRAAEVPEVVIAAIPDDWFRQMVEWSVDGAASYAFDLHRSGEAVGDVRSGVNDLFANNGVPYAFSDGGLARTSDPAAAAVATQPALGLLDDPRLAEAKRYMNSALEELQKHEPAEAIDEARHVVEAALIAVIEDHPQADMPSRNQAQQLFNALRDATVVTNDIADLVLAAPRLRNQTEAGHSGGRRACPKPRPRSPLPLRPSYTSRTSSAEAEDMASRCLAPLLQGSRCRLSWFGSQAPGLT